MQDLILPWQAKILQEQHATYGESELKDMLVPVKIVILASNYTAYLITQDPDDHDYLWAIVDWMAIEMGSVSLIELEEMTAGGIARVERDEHFKTISAQELWNKINKIDQNEDEHG